MGSCSSAANNDSVQFNDTLNRCYEVPLNKRRTSKWNYFSHISNESSSGVSSACNSASRRRSSFTPPSFQENAPRKKARHIKLNHRTIPKHFEIRMLSICDDFGEAGKMEQRVNTKSFGYYSDSMSRQSSVSPPSQSCLVHTQDTRLCHESPLLTVAPASIDLQMEMYMMSQSQSLMPKTSSPIVQRKSVTFDAVGIASPPSNSYQKWANYLQGTPTYMLHNISNIPEAIAGHFSPFGFPAFTDLEEMKSAAKIFKADIHVASKSQNKLIYSKPAHKLSSVTHTITTDL